MQYVVLRDWLFSFSIMLLWFIQVVACINISFFFFLPNKTPLYGYSTNLYENFIILLYKFYFVIYVTLYVYIIFVKHVNILFTLTYIKYKYIKHIQIYNCNIYDIH